MSAPGTNTTPSIDTAMACTSSHAGSAGGGWSSSPSGSSNSTETAHRKARIMASTSTGGGPTSAPRKYRNMPGNCFDQLSGAEYEGSNVT
jgi:hypothetical protein